MNLVSRLSERIVTITKEKLMKYFSLIQGSLIIVLCISWLLCTPLLFFPLLFNTNILVLLVYVYCRKHAMCSTWFLNSPFSCDEPSPVHQTTTIWPTILGPVCWRKRHSHTLLYTIIEQITYLKAYVYLCYLFRLFWIITWHTKWKIINRK